MEFDSLKKSVERALAFAHAAIEQPAVYRGWEVRRHANEVLASVSRARRAAMTLAEAHLFVALVGQLRAVLQVLDNEQRRALVPAFN